MMFSSKDPEDEKLRFANILELADFSLFPRVKLLDFQNIVMGHPARDLWYLLQIGTDVDFRRKHLETVFREYYIVFSSYLKAGGLKAEFTSFRDECEKFRAPVSLLFGNIVLFLTLNPEPLPMDRWSWGKKVMREMEEKLGGEEKEEDHPMVKEIRRRVTEGILELDALGAFA